MELGATKIHLGNFNSILTFGGMVLSPVYGWMMDKKSVYLPCVVSAGCCAFGCLFRGLAPVLKDDDWSAYILYGSHVLLGLGAINFWGVISIYLALATPKEKRGLALSGFQAQENVLRLLGTLLYPAWDQFLISHAALLNIALPDWDVVGDANSVDIGRSVDSARLASERLLGDRIHM